MTENAVPTLATAYALYRPLFFRALAALSRKGLPVRPSEGLDLVHDFFVEVWPGVVRSYDADRGALEGYIYRSFLHFAQRRIRRSQLLDRDALLEGGTGISAGARAPDLFVDRDAVRHALAHLPPTHADLLLAYFSSNAPSERRLARERGLSRYRLRETLVASLGRISLELRTGAPGPSIDRDVAKALWVDALTVEQAARALGLTEEDVRERHRTNVASIAAVLGSGRTSA